VERGIYAECSVSLVPHVGHDSILLRREQPYLIQRESPRMSALQMTIESPVGDLLLTARDEGLTGVWFEEHRRGRPDPQASLLTDSSTGDAAETLRATARQLAEYFAGDRSQFSIPLAAQGTPFQLQVWNALRGIPFGDAISYAELAARLGKPKAIRAVGGANARNPLSILVPCHRVIGAGGALTGFGGGMERKRWLLEHEGALAPAIAGV
jgi:methylated-DNA-[protein]-cysteine S-methyltransferase